VVGEVREFGNNRKTVARPTLRKDEWDALKNERDAERAEKEKGRMQVAGTSFFQRRRIWKEERKRVAELRRAKAAEIADLRRKERQGEDKLGPGDPPETSADKK
jgi:hypothetical protein